jgi:hypothetical protein
MLGASSSKKAEKKSKSKARGKKKKKGGKAAPQPESKSAPPPEPAREEAALAPEPEPAADVPGDNEQKADQNEQDTTEEKSPGLADEDWTSIPAAIDASLEEHDKDGALRPTTITPGKQWQKKSQGLVAGRRVVSLGVEKLRTEKQRALDLLDALSKSGALSFDQAEVHVFVATTHVFESSVMDTLICESVNPIEKIERSTKLLASVVLNRSVEEMLLEPAAHAIV